MALVNNRNTDTGTGRQRSLLSKGEQRVIKQIVANASSSKQKTTTSTKTTVASTTPKVTTKTDIIAYTDKGTGKSATGGKTINTKTLKFTVTSGTYKGINYYTNDIDTTVHKTDSGDNKGKVRGNGGGSRIEPHKADDTESKEIAQNATGSSGSATSGGVTGSVTDSGVNSDTTITTPEETKVLSVDQDVNGSDITVYYTDILYHRDEVSALQTLEKNGLSLDEIPNDLNQIVSCYIVHIGAQKWMPLPIYPESVSEGLTANWSSTSIPGRAADYYTYTGTGNRSISFNLKLHYDILSSWGNFGKGQYQMTQIINFLKACVYPHYTASNINVPVCIVKLSDSFKMRGIFTSITVNHQLPMRLITKHYSSDKAKLNLYTYYDVSCQFIEVPTYCPDYTRIVEYGGGRYD